MLKTIGFRIDDNFSGDDVKLRKPDDISAYVEETILILQQVSKIEKYF